MHRSSGVIIAALLAFMILSTMSGENSALKDSREKTVSGIVFVSIPGGSFMTGSPTDWTGMRSTS